MLGRLTVLAALPAGDAQTQEVRPGDARAREIRPADAHAAESRPQDSRPDDTGPSQSRSIETRPNDTGPGETRLLARFTAAGWTVRQLQAGDSQAADAALSAATRSQKPTLIVERGRNETDRSVWQSEKPATEAATGSAAETASAKRGASARRAWLKRLRRHTSRDAFLHAQAGTLPVGWHKAAHIQDPGAPAAASTELSTEAALRAALGRLASALPDLANMPPRDGPPQAAPQGPAGASSIIWEGLALAAASGTLGLSLHGGILPVFWSAPGEEGACLAAAHAAAKCRTRLLAIIPADGFNAGLEELFAEPNARAFTPANALETVDCLVLALRHVEGPSILFVSPVTPGSLPGAATPLCARGGYLTHAPPARAVTLAAAGLGLTAAAAVHRLLAAENVPASIVSLPSRRIFDAQDDAYRAAVLGTVPVVTFRTRPFGGATETLFQAGWPPTATPEDPARIAARILTHLGRRSKLEAS